LNWGLVGLFNFDLVAATVGAIAPFLGNVVYTLVGLAAVYQAIGLKSIQSRWGVNPATTEA